jgi:hypothetical protein
VLLALALLLGACSAEPGAMGPAVGPGGSGSVGIFLTDAPSDDFEQILVTIEGIDLIGGGPKVNLFSGSETVDLTELEQFSDLFLYADHVPARSYYKIRLHVSDISLVDGDDNVTPVKVGGGGKIDLQPRGQFKVHPGEALMIEIDMDADKMLKQSGNGKYHFSPVVFVNILPAHTPARLARVHGDVVNIIDDQSFELCTTIFMASHHESDDDEDGDAEEDDDGGLGDRHRCFTVITDELTGLFDVNGDPIDYADLSVGDPATVVGRIRLVDGGGSPAATPLGMGQGSKKHDDSKGDDDSDSDSHADSDSDSEGHGKPGLPDFDLVVDAVVVELGPPGSFLQLRGLVQSAVDDADEFDFEIGPGQGYEEGTVVSALVQQGTRIFSTEGVELDPADIVADTPAKIDGVFGTVNEQTGVLKTSLILLDVMLLEIDHLSGEILEIDDATRTLLLATVDADDNPTESCVVVPPTADLLRLSSDGAGSLTERIDFGDLETGAVADVYGAYETGVECFVADVVVTEAPADPPTPQPL